MSKTNEAAAKIPGVLKTASIHMRKLAMANTELVHTNEELKHELRLMKMAHRLEERGLEPNLTFEQKVAGLKQVDRSKLATMEQAIELAAGGFSFGVLGASTNGETKVASGETYRKGTSDALDDYVRGGHALT